MQDLVVIDTLVYAAMSHGLLILNVADPAYPETLSTLYLQEGWATDIAVEGHFVYVSEWGSASWDGPWLGAVYVIDVSSPQAPFVVARWSTPTSAYGIDVQDGLAYVVYGHVQGEEGLLILDVSDPANLYLKGQLSIDVFNSLLKVRVMRDYAFIAGTLIHVVDVHDPTNPELNSQFNPIYLPVDLVGRDGDTLLFVAGLDPFWPAYQSVLTVLNTADPSSLSELSRTPFSTRVLGVDVTDTIAFVCNSTCGLQILGISDPANPDSLGLYEVPGSAYKVAARDTLVYLVDGGLVTSDDIEAPLCSPHIEPGGPRPGDFQIVNAADPTLPVLVGFQSFPAPVTGVAVCGDIALALNDEHTDAGSSGANVTILNVSDKKRPIVLGNYATAGTAEDAAVVQDSLILVAAGMPGLEIVNIANPFKPDFLDAYCTNGAVTGVSTQGGFAFLTLPTVGIEIVDISVLPNLQHVVTIPTTYSVWSIDVSGSYLCAATLPPFSGDGEIVAYDISNPNAPTLLATLRQSIYNEVQIAGEQLIARWAQGFTVFGIADRDTIRAMGSYFGAPGGRDLTVLNNSVLITDGWEGVEIVDITNPATPTLAGRYDTPGYPQGVMARDHFVYVADLSGFLILEDKIPTDVEDPDEPSVPTSFSLNQNYPNPFNPTTTISFSLPIASDYELVIYNVNGQQVERFSGSHEAGVVDLTWDAGSLASGVYFYKLVAGSFTATKKMVLLK